MRFKSLVVSAAVLLTALTAGAAFNPGPSHVKADLIPESKAIAPGQPFWVALRMDVEKGWHIYWKNPGDSGEPVKVKWTLPDGFQAGELRFPYPQLIVVPPVYTYGHEGTVVFLIKMTPPATLKAGQTVSLAAKVKWLQCQVECIPGQANLTLKLPVTAGMAAPDPANAALFAAAREKMPIENSGWTFSATQNKKAVRLMATPPPGLPAVSDARFFPSDPDLFRYDAPQKWTPSKNGYYVDLARSDVSTQPVTAVRGVLVSERGWRGPSSEKAVSVDTPVSGTTKGGPGKGLLAAILLAFLGGMILNLMPCVLPVLSIKVLGLVHQAGDSAGFRIRHGLTYSAGVLVAFWSLAGALLLLRAGGRQLGWGFQLQSPTIVIILAGLLFLLALNLFGVFEIGAALTQYGGPSRKQGYTASFGSGLLATVVAAPCTAPFMGSALGFALTQPAYAAFAVFTALAVGMAWPYVLLTASPALLRLVPKPGAWMESMKQALSFLMAASAVWLLWVLGRQAGVDAVVATCAGFVVQGAGAWIYGRWATPVRGAVVRAVATLAAIVLIVGGAAFAITADRVSPGAAAVETSAGGISWEPFSADRVAELRAAGRPVFVDFSAAWCLTCQVNERVALEKPDVLAKVKEKNIAMLKADWTSRDPKITAALASLGRSGVPAYVLYPSDTSASPTLLPEVLTPAILVSAFDRAK